MRVKPILSGSSTKGEIFINPFPWGYDISNVNSRDQQCQSLIDFFNFFESNALKFQVRYFLIYFSFLGLKMESLLVFLSSPTGNHHRVELSDFDLHCSRPISHVYVYPSDLSIDRFNDTLSHTLSLCDLSSLVGFSCLMMSTMWSRCVIMVFQCCQFPPYMIDYKNIPVLTQANLRLVNSLGRSLEYDKVRKYC